MTPILIGEAGPFVHFVLGFLLFAISGFLILLVLVQRGRGGGLTGALGGMGGQSAFGTKAGDVFTKVTIGTAVAWILMCIICIQVFAPPAASNAEDKPNSVTGTEDEEGEENEEGEGEGEVEGEGTAIGDADSSSDATSEDAGESDTSTPNTSTPNTSTPNTSTPDTSTSESETETDGIESDSDNS